MATRFSFMVFSSILWIQFIFMIPYCEGTVHNDVDAEKPVGENPPEEEYKFQSEKIVQNPLHTFPPDSRSYKIQDQLHYLAKPYWPSQWIMTEEILKVKERIYQPSMKIAKMHLKNIKGNNVGVVIIANSEVNCNHEQLRGRCNAVETSGYSFYPKKKLISFTSSSSKKKYQNCSPKSLATAVAGIIGMTDEGPRCGVGIAPNCIIGNIVIDPFSSNGSPENCAYKLSSKENSPVALYVHAWQMPEHDYRNDILLHWGNIEYMNFGTKYSQLKPHVMGAGDLGLIANSCQTNEYTSTDSSFVFGSVAYDGYLTPYSETCASLMGVTYSTSSGVQYYNDIVTIPSSDDVLPTKAPKETTTVSAAVAGGIIALIIELYRNKHKKIPSVSDLAFLLAFSADSDTLQNKNMIWFTNAVGLRYSPQGGFGLPDLLKAKELVEIWTPLAVPRLYEFTRFDKTVMFKWEEEKTGRRSLTYSSNMSCYFSIHNVFPGFRIQSVAIEITAKLAKRGAMSVYLISPGGTVSCLLEGRPYDITKKNYKKLRLRSNHFMGEHINGQWTLKIFTYKENSRPTFEPLYAFKTKSQSLSPPADTPFPPNSERDPKNPIPGPSSADPFVVPASPHNLPVSQNSHTDKPAINPKPDQLSQASTTQGLPPALPSSSSSPTIVPPKMSQDSPGSQNSPVVEPAMNPQPELLPVSSSQNQQSQSTTSHGSPPGHLSSSSNPPMVSTESTQDLALSQNSKVDQQPAQIQPVSSHQKEQSQLLTTQSVPSAEQANLKKKEVRFADTEQQPKPSDQVPPQNEQSQSSITQSSLSAEPVSPKMEVSTETKESPSRPDDQVNNATPLVQRGSHNTASTPPMKKTGSNTKQTNPRLANEVGQIKFRFLLVESLPSELKAEQRPKTEDQTKFDFELLKIWVDFRQYLLVQTDPQNYGTSTVSLSEEVYDFTNYFIEKLLKTQEDVKSNFAASVPSQKRVDALAGIDFRNQKHLSSQHPNQLSNEESQPPKSPDQKLSTDGVPLATHRDKEHQ